MKKVILLFAILCVAAACKKEEKKQYNFQYYFDRAFGLVKDANAYADKSAHLIVVVNDEEKKVMEITTDSFDVGEYDIQERWWLYKNHLGTYVDGIRHQEATGGVITITKNDGSSISGKFWATGAYGFRVDGSFDNVPIR